MSHKRRGARAQIEAGVLGDTVPLSSLRQKCIVLSGQAGSEKMRDWDRPEFDGNAATDADSVFAAAIAGPRRPFARCRLAHGLVGNVKYPSYLDDDESAGAVLGEARDITGRRRSQPLLDRAADLLAAEPGIQGWMVTVPIAQESAPVCDG
jgi:hypothetical protein